MLQMPSPAKPRPLRYLTSTPNTVGPVAILSSRSLSKGTEFLARLVSSLLGESAEAAHRAFVSRRPLGYTTTARRTLPTP